MTSTDLSSDVCAENACKKFNLQVYADHGGLFTLFSINKVTNIVQCINIVQMVKFSQSTGLLLW